MTSFQRAFRLVAVAVLLASGAAAAEETAVSQETAAVQETAASHPERKPTNRLGTRFINAPTPFTVGSRHRFEILFTHRFLQTVQDGDEHNLWGLDSGADIGIGVTYGATDNFDLSVYRSSFQENYELSAKYLIAEQSPRVPLSIGVRLGANLLLQENVEDADRPFAQLLLSREFAPGVSLVLSPSWVRDTPRLRDAFNVPVGVTFSIKHSLFEIEWIPANQDLDESEDAWHVALSRQIGGHIFEVMVGNSRATTVDQYLGGDFAGGFESDDVRLGFNLYRYLPN